MPKTAAQTEAKLKERVAASGKYHKQGMEAADKNPNEEALKKLELMKARFDAAMESGKTAAGMREAAADKRWEKRIPVAGQRWEASSQHMTDRYMQGYADRMACVDQAKAEVATLAEITVENRAEKSKQYQIAMSKCMEAKRGITR